MASCSRGCCGGRAGGGVGAGRDAAGAAGGQSAAFTALRLEVKAALYRQSLCLARGLVSLQDEEEGEEGEGEGGGAGGAGGKAPQQAAGAGGLGGGPASGSVPGAISEQDVEEALKEEQARVWSDGGDAHARKKALAGMFAALFRQHATVARKLPLAGQ